MNSVIKLLKFATKYGAYVIVIIDIVNFAIDKFEELAKLHNNGDDINIAPHIDISDVKDLEHE